MHPALQDTTAPAPRGKTKPAPSPEPPAAVAESHDGQSPPSPLAAVQHSFDATADAFDAALIRAASGEQLSASDLSVLERSGIIRALDRERQVARMRNILKHQQISGTKEDRAAIKKLIDDAERVAQERVPEIDRQIEELTRERERLVTAVDKPKERLKEMEQSVSALRESRLLPPALTVEYEGLKRSHWRFSSEVQRAKGYLDNCNRALQRIDSGATEVYDDVSMSMRAVTPGYVEILTRRRDQFQVDVEMNQRLYDAARADQGRLLDRYVL